MPKTPLMMLEKAAEALNLVVDSHLSQRRPVGHGPGSKHGQLEPSLGVRRDVTVMQIGSQLENRVRLGLRAPQRSVAQLVIGLRGDMNDALALQSLDVDHFKPARREVADRIV